ncbi:MAG: hypothetical protein EP343_24615 [Deltaproteobacteria bacterium]|nr:MAG: hypothetical protein EP343_24615 [Deltaproteobacteria bacterium]
MQRICETVKRKAEQRFSPMFWLLVGLWMCYPAGNVQAAPQYSDCIKLFRAKQFSKAATCFEGVAQSLNKPGLTSKQRIRKGRALRNAANLLEKAAKKTERVEVAGYWRERAVKLLQQYLDEDLHEVKYQKRGAEAMRLKLYNAIGYTTLTLVLGQTNATFVLQGYKSKVRGTGTWSRSIRPGPYQLRVKYPSGQAVDKRFYLSPRENKVITLKPKKGPNTERKQPPKLVGRRTPPPDPRLTRRPPPPKPRRSKAAAWVTLGIGAAVTLGGGALLIAAKMTDDQKNALAGRGAAAAEQNTSASIVAMQGTAEALFPTGWVMLGVGAAATVTGGVLFTIK